MLPFTFASVVSVALSRIPRRNALSKWKGRPRLRSATGVGDTSGVMGAGSRRFFKYVYVHMTAFPFELMIAMMHMIGEGVFDRYPRLKIGFMEGGADWLPFWMERLEEHVEKLAPQMPELKRRPSEIIRSDQLVLSSCNPPVEPVEASAVSLVVFVVNDVGLDQGLAVNHEAHEGERGPS